MPHIDLKYRHKTIPVDFDKSRFSLIDRHDGDEHPLSDVEIGERLDSPIGTQTLEELIDPTETVLIVVPDATRDGATGQIVNLVVRRLIAQGTAPNQIRIIFATGIHRKVTEAEQHQILTPFIAQRIKTLDHDPRDLFSLIRIGEIPGGIPVEVNRALVDHDRVILVGSVNFHYFAGFTGGRKLVCPGLASSRTIAETHKLAFDCDARTRREGVGPALLAGNAVHEAFDAAVEMVKPDFAITTMVDDDGSAVEVICGDWRESHREACQRYADSYTLEIAERRPLVIVSGGGHPHDVNFIQAHKALDTAAAACTPGGTIVLLAECSDGLGRSDFLDWFDAPDSAEMAKRLCEKYQVNGQTAWSTLRKAEDFNIKIVTDLDAETTKKMRLEKIEAADLDGFVAKANSGYILPRGAKLMVRETFNS